jgi:hypothetical protein
MFRRIRGVIFREFSKSLLNCCPITWTRNGMRAVYCIHLCGGMLLVEGMRWGLYIVTLDNNSAGSYWTHWRWRFWFAETRRSEIMCKYNDIFNAFLVFYSLFVKELEIKNQKRALIVNLFSDQCVHSTYNQTYNFTPHLNTHHTCR